MKMSLAAERIPKNNLRQQLYKINTDTGSVTSTTFKPRRSLNVVKQLDKVDNW